MFRFATFFTFNKYLLQFFTLISFPYYYKPIFLLIENEPILRERVNIFYFCLTVNLFFTPYRIISKMKEMGKNIVPIQLVGRKLDKDHLMIFLFLFFDSSIKVK